MSEFKTLPTVVNIFVSPGEAFKALKEHPAAWLPIVALIVGYVAMQMLYLNLVDQDWLNETQIRMVLGDNLSEAEIQQAVSSRSGISANVQAAISAVGIAIVLPLIMFLFALYLKIVSFATNDGVTLKSWFGLVAWCSLIGWVTVLASIANLLMNDVTFMPPAEINPLSFVNLFGLETGPGVRGQVMQNFNATSIWTLLLMVFGHQAFRQRSLFTSAAIVLAPYILIGGAVLYFALG